MADEFEKFQDTPTRPADTFAAITPNDSVEVDPKPKSLFIGGAGNLAVTGSDDVEVTFAVVAGQVLPIRPKLIKSTGTTATGIVALS